MSLNIRKDGFEFARAYATTTTGWWSMDEKLEHFVPFRVSSGETKQKQQQHHWNEFLTYHSK